MKKIGIFFVFVALVIIGGFLWINRDTYFPRWISVDEEKNGISEDAITLETFLLKGTRNVLNPYSEVTIISNNKITLKSGAQTELKFVGTDEDRHFYVARVDSILKGESKRKILVIDEFGQEKQFEVSFVKTSTPVPAGYDSLDGWEGAEYVLDGSDYLFLVDKKHRFFEDFEPNDIINLNEEYGIYTFNNARLRRDAAANLKRMWQDCGETTGDYFTVVSGYRSWIDQFEIYAINVNAYGEKEANTFSAKPGHSEHQSGLAVDITNSQVNYKLDVKFADTKSGKWLIENSYKYGFSPSYPKEAQPETGFYEPWQFRFVGIDNAEEHFESGMTLVDWIKSNNNTD